MLISFILVTNTTNLKNQPIVQMIFRKQKKIRLNKLEKLRKNNVRVILQPGDLLDKPTLPNNFVEAILEEWGKLTVYVNVENQQSKFLIFYIK